MGLLEQDHILVNKLLYRVIREPRFGDVIVFKAPPNASMDGKEHDFIKRLIGEPGDTLRITQGYVMVGDIKLLHTDLRDLLADKTPKDKYDIRAKIVKDGVLMNGHKVSAKEIADAVGEPSAKVKFHPGLLYRNGKPLYESYTAEDSEFEFPEIKVPKGRYFMLGDNRNMSRDSRFWGPLERKRVMGKPLFRFFPLDRLGLVH
jgi:signal peptidase I